MVVGGDDCNHSVLLCIALFPHVKGGGFHIPGNVLPDIWVKEGDGEDVEGRLSSSFMAGMMGQESILPFSVWLIRDRFRRMDPHIAADLSALDTAALHSRLSELGSYL